MSSIMFFDVFRFKGKTDTQKAMRKIAKLAETTRQCGKGPVIVL
jgi:hypothetical protein